jgi:hypothetical protein
MSPGYSDNSLMKDKIVPICSEMQEYLPQKQPFINFI